MSPSTLTPGTHLGPYEILSALGAGGMGEVYRAHDTKLGRDVAIKVLLPAVANDPERLARFSREAQVLASLNHPNIAAIYGLEDAHGTKGLILELVEGPTLADRIAQGPIPLDEALPIAKQIAEALEAAHEQGIIHRDLKPANIKVRPDGTVKVLDFGLAKAMDLTGTPSANASMSPTMSLYATRAGIILGTAAYMSPEQASGKTADKRSDLWAFGVVFLEMLTGCRVFDGETVSHVLAAVLKTEPDWTTLSAQTPQPIRRLLRRCLEKDRKRRLDSAANARLEIDDALKTPLDVVSISPAQTAIWRRPLPWAVGGAFLAALALSMSAMRFRESAAAEAPEIRFEVSTPGTADPLSFAISPDGGRLAFASIYQGVPRLMIRPLNALSVQPLNGTEGASFPFWAPDGRSIGFFADAKLKRIDLETGSVQTLATSAVVGRGGAWHRDGAILFAPTAIGAIWRVSATGGEPTATTRLEAQQTGHLRPQFLPDGEHFLYSVSGNPDVRGVYVAALHGSATRRLLDADAAASVPGRLLFVRHGALVAQPFDAVRLALTGNPETIAEQVAVERYGYAALAAATANVIVYRSVSGVGQQQLTWFDRAGKALSAVGEPSPVGTSVAPSMSPDGKHVAFMHAVNGQPDVWLLDLERNVPSRFTTDAVFHNMPIWSADAGAIVFTSSRAGRQNLYQKATTGIGPEELLPSTDAQFKAANDFSRDGRFLLYMSFDANTAQDLWALPLDGIRIPVPVVQTSFNERDGQFSPNGQWIAYQSDESGQFEIYVQRFPTGGGRERISTDGGEQVRWSRDGQELFYIARDGRLMAVPIRRASNGQALEVGAPVPLFGAPVAQNGVGQQYMVSNDGQRFLMNAIVNKGDASPLTVVLNWKPTPGPTK